MKETKFYTVKELIEMGKIDKLGVNKLEPKVTEQFVIADAIGSNIIFLLKDEPVDVKSKREPRPMEGQMSFADVYPTLKLERKK
jgi:hypothetical protein